MKNQNTIVYRVQIGAFKVELSEEIFSGVDNVISFKGNDGFVRYMTGSFADRKKSIDYMYQMRARGFDDAFVVSYKNGERSIEYFAPIKKSMNNIQENDSKTDNKGLVKDKKAERFNKSEEAIKNSQIAIDENSQIAIENLNIEYIVQIFVGRNIIDASNLKMMEELENVDKESLGSDMDSYFVGPFNTIEKANIALLKAQSVGFKAAFIIAKKDGVRIPFEQAKELIK